MHHRLPAREEIRHLKKRRDVLMNTACNRQEQEKMLQEVREINRALQELQKKIG